VLSKLSGAGDDADSGDDLRFSVPDDASSLEGGDTGDSLTPDPKPSRRKSARKIPVSTGKPTVAQKKQVRDALLLLMTPATGFWAMRDQHCGGAAFEQREAIVDAMVPIICRNANMLRWFTAADAPWLDYLALLTALQPVGMSVWQHHVKHTIGEGGEPADYSAYTA
jgi:hypothetical protein